MEVLKPLAINVLEPKRVVIYLGLSEGVPSIFAEQFIHKQISLRAQKSYPLGQQLR